MVTYESLEEMEQKADLIVTGKKIEGDLYVHKSASGQPHAAYSRFQIKSLLKDATENFKEGDEILVMEPDIPDEEEGVRYHVDDYTAMNRQDEYILFLQYNESGYPKACTILGVNFGVCSLGRDYKMKSYGGDTHEEIDRWRENIREKYLPAVG
ncbi:MAG: hypothetical protein IJK86_05425 [Lachnospiraceae bacterium]|nr:hypothetical protein [Lachnospiraceae bacterium]